MCDNSELILGYVYGELPEGGRREFDAHLARCTDCRREVAELSATRSVLASWAPPEPDFGFRIVRGSQVPAPARRRFAFTPAWGLAAAAVLVLAAAAAIANVEVRYDAAGLVVRTGWAREAAVQQASAANTTTDVPAPAISAADVAALASRVQQLEAAVGREPAAAPAQTAATRASDEALLRQVREMFRENDARHERATAAQIAQVAAEFDRVRQHDFMRLQQGVMGQLRGATSAEVAQQLNYYLTRASQQK